MVFSRPTRHFPCQVFSTIYHKTETAAEKKIWQLARQNPDVDITVCESLVFPPSATHFVAVI